MPASHVRFWRGRTMKGKTIVLYAAAGAALGALSGVLATAAALNVRREWMMMAVLAGIAGAVLAAAGGIVARSRRALVHDAVLGFLFAAAAFYPLVISYYRYADDYPGLVAVGSVMLATAFGFMLGFSHMRATGQRGARFGAATFASVAALFAVAAAAQFLSGQYPYITAAASGALAGALIWGAIAAAARLLGVRAEDYRVEK